MPKQTQKIVRELYPPDYLVHAAEAFLTAGSGIWSDRPIGVILRASPAPARYLCLSIPTPAGRQQIAIDLAIPQRRIQRLLTADNKTLQYTRGTPQKGGEKR